jgi:hypothetical protein
MDLSNLELSLDNIIFIVNTNNDYKNIVTKNLKEINQHKQILLNTIKEKQININNLSITYMELIIKKIIIIFSFVTYSEIMISTFLLFSLLLFQSKGKKVFSPNKSIVDNISEDVLDELNIMISLLEVNKDLKTKIKKDVYEYIFSSKI